MGKQFVRGSRERFGLLGNEALVVLENFGEHQMI